MYSPPRIPNAAALLPNLEVIPGFALDLTNGWDSTIPEHRERAMKKVKIEKPKMLIGSPRCSWQYINDKKRDEDVVAWEKKRALTH